MERLAKLPETSSARTARTKRVRLVRASPARKTARVRRRKMASVDRRVLEKRKVHRREVANPRDHHLVMVKVVRVRKTSKVAHRAMVKVARLHVTAIVHRRGLMALADLVVLAAKDSGLAHLPVVHKVDHLVARIKVRPPDLHMALQVNHLGLRPADRVDSVALVIEGQAAPAPVVMVAHRMACAMISAKPILRCWS